METAEPATESCVEPVTPFWVAWIVVVPSSTLVTKPVALTVAMPGLLELQAAVAVMSRVLPSLYVPVALNCSLEPKTILGLEGEMAMEVRAITVNEVEPVTALKVAEIVVVPGPAAVASPVLAPTVATPALLDLQVALVVRFCVLPSLYVPVALNCSLEPKTMLGLEGEMAMEVRAITVNEVEPVTALKVAEIVVVPGPAAVASPVLAPTVATPALLELQVALVVKSCVLLSEKIPVAVNCWVAGKITVPLAGVT